GLGAGQGRVDVDLAGEDGRHGPVLQLVEGGAKPAGSRAAVPGPTRPVAKEEASDCCEHGYPPHSWDGPARVSRASARPVPGSPPALPATAPRNRRAQMRPAPLPRTPTALGARLTRKNAVRGRTGQGF